MSTATTAEKAFRENQRLLWGLCYRMTGSAVDADDLVQETFARSLAHPPPRAEEPWRPWLVKVAVNLGRDHLRARKSRAYTGPWLPAPVELAAYDLEHAPSPEARYDLAESATFAFLVALEALSDKQRAVLLLRDVFDLDVAETARLLEISESDVKVSLHRARAAMESYDRARCVPTPDRVEKTAAALQRLMEAIGTGDPKRVEAALAADATMLNDGAGVYRAALNPVTGAKKIASFLIGIVQKIGRLDAKYAPITANGLPAIYIELEGTPDDVAPRSILRCDVDDAGAITAVHMILAPEKLEAI